MVQIPVYKENQRLQASNPTGFQSSGNARLMGEALSSVGTGVANVGLALEENAKKLKAAKNKTDAAQVKNAAEIWAQDMSAKLELSGGDGSTFVEDYDKDWSKSKDKIINELNKKGIATGMTAGQVEAIADDVYSGYRKNLSTMAVTRQKNKLKESVVTLTAQYTSDAYSAPERLDEHIADYGESIGGAMQAMGRSERQTQEFNRTGAQQLTRQAVLGFIDKGKFDQAKKVIVEKGSLFSPEEQRGMLKEVSKSKLDARRLLYSEVDRQERQIEAERKVTQTKELNTLYGELNEARTSGNPALIASLNKKIGQKIAEGRVATSAFGGLVSQAGNAEREMFSQTAFGLMKDYYEAKDAKDYAALEDKVHLKVAAGRIDEESALKVLKLLNTSKTSSPLSKAELGRYKAVEHQLESMLPGPDTIQKMMIQLSPAEASAHAAKYHGIKAELEIGKANGIPASETMTSIVFKYFEDIERQEPFRGMGGDIYNKVLQMKDAPLAEQQRLLKEVKTWGYKTFRGNPANASDFEKWYNRLENNARMNNIKNQILKIDKDIIQSENKVKADQYLGGVVDEVVEEASKPASDPDTLPLILRNYGE